ncbi:hypothetical protein L7F22_023695 [Adiantum nelumboides]|nr:hypothetical protein [Adiantum nelumboides]
MAGIANQQPYMASPSQLNSGQGTQRNPNIVPMFQSLPYDNLTPLEKPTPYKEGGKGVTFTTFTGFDDRKKALSFLQQFDKAGGNFTEASKTHVGDVQEDMPVEDEPEVEELDEILVLEQILAHKERKVKGKVATRYLAGFINSKKSTFGVQEVSYLGFIISSDGIRLDPEKITAISSWEIPQTAQQIRSFVGRCQAYSRHMRNFSKIAAPLTDLLKGCKTKRQRVAVEGKSLEAFYALQKLASEAPVLKIASWEEPFEVITDASNIAIGAVLQQDLRPVSFYSKKLDSAQLNYSVYDKELFAIISALKHLKHFLYGREFTVKTDHQALKWLQTMPSADWSDRQSKWS